MPPSIPERVAQPATAVKVPRPTTGLGLSDRGPNPPLRAVEPDGPWRTGSVPPPTPFASGPDVPALLKALRRRWTVALGLSLLLAGIVGAAAWFLLSPKYTTFALVRVAASKPTLLSGAESTESRTEFLTLQRTHAAHLKSRFVLSAALKRPEVQRLEIIQQQPDPLAWLEEELRVDYNENSELLNVNMIGPNPQEMIPILNAVTQSYQKEVVDQERKALGDKVRQLEALESNTKEQMRRLRDEWRRNADAIGTGDPEDLRRNHDIFLTKLDEKGRQLSQIQEELRKKRRLLDTLKSREKMIAELAKPETDLGDVLNPDPALLQVLAPLTKEALAQRQLNVASTLADLKKQFSAAQAELLRREAVVVSLKKRMETLDEQEVPVEELNLAIDADPKVRELDARMTVVRERIKRYDEAGARADEPSRKTLAERLAGLQTELDTLREQLRSDKAEQYRRGLREANQASLTLAEEEAKTLRLEAGTLAAGGQKLAEKERKEIAEWLRKRLDVDYKNSVAELDQEIRALVADEQKLEGDVQRLSRESEKSKANTTELDLLKEKIDQADEYDKNVSSQLAKLRPQLEQPSRVSVFQEAGIQKKDMKRQLAGVILGPLAVVVGTCFLVARREHRRHRIHTPAEVVNDLGMRVVGAVPSLSEASRRAVTTNADEEIDASLLESIDGIRTMLLHDAGIVGLRVVMVTSAVSGEGKTTLASHLAGSLARAGRKTLLVDGDLRRPNMHVLFELALFPGLSEALLGEVPVTQAIRPTALDNLSLMPAGQWDRDVIQALAQDSTGQLLDQLRSDYDFVVLDSPPVLQTPDALVLGQHADAVIVALMREISEGPKVYAVCQKLAELNIRVLGAVMNAAHEDDGFTPVAPYPARAAV